MLAFKGGTCKFEDKNMAPKIDGMESSHAISINEVEIDIYLNVRIRPRFYTLEANLKSSLSRFVYRQTSELHMNT